MQNIAIPKERPKIGTQVPETRESLPDKNLHLRLHPELTYAWLGLQDEIKYSNKNTGR